jgi:flagellar basal body-associated protein FliL
MRRLATFGYNNAGGFAMKRPRLRLSTIMLLIVIFALAIAFAAQTNRLARQARMAAMERRRAEQAMYTAQVASAQAALRVTQQPSAKTQSQPVAAAK